jgi:hypothetical protein
MLRWRNRWVAWSALAFVAAALALVSWFDSQSPSSTAVAASMAPAIPPAGRADSSRPASLSCKASPDVTITLAPGFASSEWNLRVDALAPAARVVVSIGAKDADVEGNRRIVWRGALARGAGRDFRVTYSPPSGVTEVWAEAALEGTGTAIHRSRAVISIQDGKPVARLAAEAPAGRLVRDAQSGETFLELPGAVGSDR